MTGFEVTTANLNAAHACNLERFVEQHLADLDKRIQQIHTVWSGDAASLQDGLSGCGAMAGGDPGCTQWAGAYDEATVQIVGVTQDVINGVYRLAALLEMTGFNHGRANSARQGRPSPGRAPRPG